MRRAGWELIQWRDFDGDWQRPPFDRCARVDELVQLLNGFTQLLEFAELSVEDADNLSMISRAGRHLLRTRLRWGGFGSPAPGTWISTHTDRAKDVEFLLREAGVYENTQIFISEYVGGSDLPTLVRQAWSLDEVETEYQQFLATFARQPSTDPLVRFTRLVHAWRQLPLIDPALPKELLPDWIGTQAVKLFHRQYAKWRPASVDEWGRISRQAR